MKHSINIIDPPERIQSDNLIRFVENILSLFESEPVELTIAFIEETEMQKLNFAFRGKDYATDVLSFPMGEPQPEANIYLGDIAISHTIAEQQARENGQSFEKEIFQLTAHGVLHLLGFDHETDDGEMEEQEKHIDLEVRPHYC